MRLAIDRENLPFGVLRPDGVVCIDRNNLRRESRIVPIGAVAKFRRQLAARRPVDHRESDVDIIG